MIFLIVIFSLVLLAFGFEMFLVLGVPALMVKELFFSSIPDTVIIQKMVGGINHSTLLAIPFFIIAAEIMSSGEIARRLTNFIKKTRPINGLKLHFTNYPFYPVKLTYRTYHWIHLRFYPIIRSKLSK